jgi:trehalose 6-phosphate phosphatase
MSERAWQRLEEWSRDLPSVGVFTDIDGTLAPIVPTPDMSEVPEKLRSTLSILADRCAIVAGVSGRTARDAYDLLRLDGMVYFGNHGFELLRDGAIWVIPEARPYRETVEHLERRCREELGPLGAFVESKGITASIHYRNVPPEIGERCREFVTREGERLGLRITVGRGVVEARPPVSADKGTAVRRLVEEYRPKRALFAGDDTTDLDAFRELRRLRDTGALKEALIVGVESEEGPPEIVREADLVVDGVEGVGSVLRLLARGAAS